MIQDRLGRALRDLRISVTDECNFRCTYCMPKDLFGEGHPFISHKGLLSFSEIVAIAEAAVSLGVHKIKLTGGEPLLRPGLCDLIAQLKAIPGLEDLGLITNGFYLARQAQDLKAAGLSRLTVSLDSLKPEVFDRISGRTDGLLPVLKGIEAALREGFSPLKVNMVVQRGVNSQEMVTMAQAFRGTPVVLRFIEYMDVGTRHRYDSELLVPSREVLGQLEDRWPLERAEAQYTGEVATRYLYKDGQGEVGFISSMTQPFCGACSRLRLSADGKLFRCLFSSLDLDLRSLLRRENPLEGDALREVIARFWGFRDDRYSELRGQQLPQQSKVEMYKMGG